MTPDVLLTVALIGLIFAAFTAIGSRLLIDFSRRELDIYCRRHRLGERFAEIMAEHDRVVLSIASLRTVSVAVALISGAIVVFRENPAPQWPAFASIVAASALGMLLILNWIPAALVRLFSAPLLFRTWAIWKTLEPLGYPLTIGISLIDAFFRRAAGRPTITEEEEEEAFEDEIRAIVTSGMREGFMEEDAREMIEGVMDLGDDTAENIMTPRGEVDAIEVDTPWPQLLDYITHVKRTRVPVFRDTLDNVVGVLYAKDLLPELSKPEADRRPLAKLLRSPWYVPGSIPVDELLKDFLENRKHLAIVVDEYRAVAGVVTIEDALEEIVGEIHDEADLEDEPAEFRPVDGLTTDVAARAQIEDVNSQLGLALPESDVYDTLGGYFIAHVGYIPEPGESIQEHGCQLTVMEADRRRIQTIRVKRLPPQRESA